MRSPTRRPVVALTAARKTYGEGETAVHALAGVDLTIERGDYVAIMGSSGSGKSTLMNIIGCLDVPTVGRYLLDGVDVRRLDDAPARAASATARSASSSRRSTSSRAPPRSRNVELPLAYAGVKAGERRRAGARRRWTRSGLADRRRARAEPAVRRSAAAGRGRPRHRHRAGAAAGRRADRRPRQPQHRRGARAVRRAERRRPHGRRRSPTRTRWPRTPSGWSGCATAGSSPTSAGAGRWPPPWQLARRSRRRPHERRETLRFAWRA